MQVMELKILIADDEVIRLMALKAQLINLGHSVVGEAANGAEAIALVSDLKPDLAIMDIRMPVMDGITAARRITEEHPLPIIMLTAYSERSLVKEATNAGAFAYLVKPVSEQDLMPAIDMAISRFRELDLLRREVGNLNQALDVRSDVEKAKGILMERCRISETEAFRMLRDRSSQEGQKVVDIARAIITAHRFF